VRGTYIHQACKASNRIEVAKVGWPHSKAPKVGKGDGYSHSRNHYRNHRRPLLTSHPRAKTRSNGNDSRDRLTPPTQSSCSFVMRDQASTSYKASCSFTSSMAEQPNNLVSIRFSDEDNPTGSSTEHTTHTAKRQQHELLGLALQYSSTIANDKEYKIPIPQPQALSDEKIASCPVHRDLLAGLSVDAAVSNGTAPDPKNTLMPMERYLAEGLAERYALFSFSYSETGREWARFSDCVCGE